MRSNFSRIGVGPTACGDTGRIRWRIKNDELEVAAFRLRKGFVTQEEYEREVAEIEEKYKGLDPDKKI